MPPRVARYIFSLLILLKPSVRSFLCGGSAVRAGVSRLRVAKTLLLV